MAELQATLEKVNGHEHARQNGLGLDAEAATTSTYNGGMPAFDEIGDSKTRAAAEAQIESPLWARSTQSKAAGEADSTQHKAASSPRRASNAGDTKNTKSTKSAAARIKYVPQGELDAELAKLETLSHAAMTGDTAALDRLREQLDSCPHLWRRVADLQLLIEIKMIEQIAGKDPLRAEAFRKRNSEIRHELNGAGGSISTKLAASRLLACWQVAQYVELRFLESPMERDWGKRLEQSQRRYESAMRTYVMAKRLDLQLQQAAAEKGQRGG
jgi:hypothetical protein